MGITTTLEQEAFQNYGCYIKYIHPGADSVFYSECHNDNYWIFGIVTSGNVRCSIDFSEIELTAGEMMFIRPGQIHKFISADKFEAQMLVADNSIISDSCRHVLDMSASNNIPIKINEYKLSQMTRIFQLIQELSNNCGISIIRNLAIAYIGIFTDIIYVEQDMDATYSSRQLELISRFKSLVDKNITTHHTPSFYAGELNISTTYLNELVRKICGFNVSNYIRDEIILRAKRMLHQTNMSIKEISTLLGFDDSAYFSRVFTNATGKTPSQYKNKPRIVQKKR